jgi:hypothetical protein
MEELGRTRPKTVSELIEIASRFADGKDAYNNKIVTPHVFIYLAVLSHFPISYKTNDQALFLAASPLFIRTKGKPQYNICSIMIEISMQFIQCITTS